MAKKKETVTVDELVKKAIVPKEEEPYKIPDNWVWTRLGEVSEIVSARRVKKSDWQKDGIPFYRAREIVKLSSDKNWNDNELFISKDLYEKFSAEDKPLEGDLMISAVGTLGKTYIVKKNDVFYYKDASVLCLHNIGKFPSLYIKYFMQTPFMEQQIKSNSTGTTVDTLTISRMKEYKFPLPPLEEQKRIVKKVESMLDKISQVREIINETREKAILRKESLLNKAFTGELTAKWRDSNPLEPAENLLVKINEEKMKKWEEECKKVEEEGIKKPKKPKCKTIAEMIVPKEEEPYKIPDNWVWTRLGEVCDIVTGNTPSKRNLEYWENKDINFVKPGDLDINRDLYDSEEKIDNRAFHKIRLVPKFSTLLCCIGSLGKSSFAMVDVATNQQINSLVPKTGLFPLYNFYFTKTLYLKYQMIENSSATTVTILNKSATEKLLFPLPPLEEQIEIVRIVDKVMEQEKEVDRLCDMENSLELLEKSILDRAFRGELGTNIPKEESAVEILRKIKEEQI